MTLISDDKPSLGSIIGQKTCIWNKYITIKSSAQSELSLLWTHMPICWCCLEAAQMLHLFLMTNHHLVVL